MKVDFIFKQGQDGNWSFVLTRAPIWCVVAPQKRCQCLSGNHSSSVKSVLNVRVSLISRALPSLTSENRVHFISVRLWIQPMQSCHLTASSEWLLMFPLFGILDLWLFLHWGRFSYFADGWRKFGFPCVQKTANCDFRWLVHFLSKSVWILLFFSQLSSGNILFLKNNHLSFHALTQFLRSSSLGSVSRDTICCWNWKVTLALKDTSEGEGGKKSACIEAQVSREVSILAHVPGSPGGMACLCNILEEFLPTCYPWVFCRQFLWKQVWASKGHLRTSSVSRCHLLLLLLLF